MSGYPWAERSRVDGDRELLALGIPNRETRSVFENQIAI